MNAPRLRVLNERAPLFESPAAGEDAEMDVLLERWARYVRTRRPPPGTCGSVEKFYRAPPQYHYPNLVAHPQVIESERRLMQDVDKAVRVCPRLERLLLIAHYVYKANPVATCRKLGLHKSLYGPRVRVARCMVRNILKRAEVA